ncbi:response regulator [Erythrobacter sp. YT30]|uniref:response regulator n=1 Tax=Erythrobacter sp. YT30 TaxID=1735012 RepID=UPI00076D9910|nr:response regulator [Erythrobacter sp. YT30]KWV91232.1 two-component system response regulator [Erythrobacter sp. YT30]
MSKRIMVVEDNDLNRKLFCDVLKANGFDVASVADGRSVIELAKDYSPDLIIMDIQLPGVSGIDLIQTAREESLLQKVPILAVTAFAAKGDEERVISAGATKYLAKPVSIVPFMGAVMEMINS